MNQFEKIIASIIIIIIFGTINYIGVEQASFYNKFSTLIKTLGITIFTVAGLAMFEGDFLNPHVDNSHDANREKYRRLNLLFYVSPDWKMRMEETLNYGIDLLKIKSLFHLFLIGWL